MAKTPPKEGRHPARSWVDVLRTVAGPDGFAYRPHEVVTGDPDRAMERSRELFGDRVRLDDARVGKFARLLDVPDPLLLVADLRVEGVAAQPNHVFFAACCCGPHPALACAGGAHASPVYASPVYASPVYASPVYASPVYASPVYASPVYASPNAYPASGHRRSSIRPVATADAATAAARLAATAPAGPRVVVLDTGFSAETYRPAALATAIVADNADREVPDDDGDDRLDPAAGHGTFIAGVVRQLSPGSTVELHRVIEPLGDGDEWAIAQCILGLADAASNGDLLNLSFSGYTLERPDLLAYAVRNAQHRGYTVVAAAGNDGVCRPTFPAALPDVVAVGAIGPNGPALFSNYGSWVQACAPGVDIISTFFKGFDGAETATGAGVDPDAFLGWGSWSGTSFATPVVVGALAREMAFTGCSAAEAVDRVIRAPGLYRIPGLGTVVNAL